MVENNMTMMEDQTCPAVGYQSASILCACDGKPLCQNGRNIYQMLRNPCGGTRKGDL